MLSVVLHWSRLPTLYHVYLLRLMCFVFQGSLEDQLHRLKEYEQGVYAYKPHIEELEKIHQAVQEGMIFENR